MKLIIKVHGAVPKTSWDCFGCHKLLPFARQLLTWLQTIRQMKSATQIGTRCIQSKVYFEGSKGTTLSWYNSQSCAFWNVLYCQHISKGKTFTLKAYVFRLWFASFSSEGCLGSASEIRWGARSFERVSEYSCYSSRWFGHLTRTPAKCFGRPAGMRPQGSAMTHWKLCISPGLEMPPCPQKSWVSRLGKSTSGHLCSDCWPCHLDSDKERLVFLAEYKITPFTFIYLIKSRQEQWLKPSEMIPLIVLLK